MLRINPKDSRRVQVTKSIILLIFMPIIFVVYWMLALCEETIEMLKTLKEVYVSLYKTLRGIDQ